MKKALSMLLMLSLLMTMTSAVAQESSYTAGTYRGKGTGNGGALFLDVTFDETSITEIKIAEHYESPTIGGVAMEKHIAQVLEEQGIAGVEAIAGATVTYNGFMTAMQSAMDQAMGLIKEAELSTEDLTVDTQVLVIGSGISGLTAAVSAAENGADVVVLEKRDTYGTSGHSITAVGTSWQKATGHEDSVEDLAKFWLECGTAYGNTTVNKDMIYFAAAESANTIDWLAAQGVEFVGCTMAPTNPFQHPYRTHVTTSSRDGQAAYIIPLYNKALELGVEFYFAATATELIQAEDGAIVGAVASNEARTITVNADAVVLATGGFRSSNEMIAEHYPLNIHVDVSGGFATGDGHRMAEAVGANMVYNAGAIGYFSNPEGIATDNPGYAMCVDVNGERFFNENDYILHRTSDAVNKGMSMYYGVFDSENMIGEATPASIENGSVFVADTLEELAEKMGVKKELFLAQIERYNSYCETGIDEEFGKPASRVGYVFDPNREHAYEVTDVEQTFVLLNKLDAAPYYAVKYMMMDSFLMGTVGGCEINIDTQVMSTDGEAIPGLYANGEVANAQLLGAMYPQAGASLSFCTTYGRVAGAKAAEYALSK